MPHGSLLQTTTTYQSQVLVPLRREKQEGEGLKARKGKGERLCWAGVEERSAEKDDAAAAALPLSRVLRQEEGEVAGGEWPGGSLQP